MNERLRQSLRDIVKLLVAGKYIELEALTKGVRLSAPEMAKAVGSYGRQLVVPPDNAFRFLDAVEVRNMQPSRWSVTMPLWTQEEGRSDLSLEVTLIDRKQAIEIELNDIHVL